jgi:hypothetical protein
MPMAAIYNADVFCDKCADKIREEICDELWGGSIGDTCPDGTAVSDFDSRDELDEYLRYMDESDYDSDSYPKYSSDSAEADTPQHCGAHCDCLNPTALADGSKIGHFFGNNLTTDGIDYIMGAVREDLESGCTDSVAIQVWYRYYDWLDWGDIDPCLGCPGETDGRCCASCPDGTLRSGDTYSLPFTD